MSKRKKYSREFKLEAVKLIKQEGVTYRQASEDLGVSSCLLVRWVKEAEARGDVAFPGSGKLTPEQEHVRQLEEKVRRLTLERDILKKTMAYFAREPG